MSEGLALPRGFRAMLEELADLAVLLLDQLDGDVDLEPWLAGSHNTHYALDAEDDEADDEYSGDEHEPSLGSRDPRLDPDQTGWAMGATDDREGEHDGREPDDGDYEPDQDGEPSLESLDRATDQRRWAHGEPAGYDHELDSSDAEYSLGAPAVSIGDQELWSYGLNSDREEDGDNLQPDESGIADLDGMHEQTGFFAGDGIWFAPADAAAVDDVRSRLAAIMDRIGRRPATVVALDS